jgi:hypothetical protein
MLSNSVYQPELTEESGHKPRSGHHATASACEESYPNPWDHRSWTTFPTKQMTPAPSLDPGGIEAIGPTPLENDLNTSESCAAQSHLGSFYLNDAKDTAIDAALLLPPIMDVPIDPSNLCSVEQKKQLRRIVYEYRDLWTKESKISNKVAEMGIQLRIETDTPATFQARPKTLHPEKRKILQDLLQHQLDHGIIEPSNSPVSSLVLLVPKPGGKWRFCINYSELNKISKSDSYLPPRIDEYFGALNGMQFFSSFDLTDAYWQIPLHPDS